MRVVAVPQLADNYGWLLIDPDGVAAIVDAAEAEPVLDAVEREGVRLVAVLSTHHHADHVGANLAVAEAVPGLRVIGNAADAERIPGLTEPVQPGEVVAIGALRGEVLDVRCHTTGHLAYRFGEALFSGDTLFAAGCGRFFEGTAAEMFRALDGVIGALPDTTLVYCGHEYTANNLRFARFVEPESPAIAEAEARVAALRARGLPSVPTRLGDERRYNPFLRARIPAVAARAAALDPSIAPGDPVAVLGALRRAKDDFR